MQKRKRLGSKFETLRRQIKADVREESFITRWGGRLHFHVVGKHFDDPPNPVGKTYSTPPDI